MRLIDADKGMERVKKSIFNSDMETTLGVAAFEKMCESAPMEKAVIINSYFEHILIYALRYAAMRENEVVDITIWYTERLIPFLSEWGRNAIKSIVYDVLDSENTFAGVNDNIAFMLLMKKWRELKTLLEEVK